jgi:hypothetical protein
MKKGRRICAWCKKDLGPANLVEDTHSICVACTKDLVSDAAEAVETIDADELERHAQEMREQGFSQADIREEVERMRKL